MRRLAVAVAAFAALIGSAAAQAGPASTPETLPSLTVEVGGQYQIEGTNFDGTKYIGTATITFQSKIVCSIEWNLGPTTAQGTCMRNGNMFAATYLQQGAVGLLSYQIMDDGALDGAWVISGETGYGTERLTPVR